MRKIPLFALSYYIIIQTFVSSCAVIPTCPNQTLPIIEVQINNTASTHDDYITTTGFTQCRARIVNFGGSSSSDRTFPGGVEVEIRNRNLSTALRLSTTSSGGSGAFFATLPSNGDWYTFFVRGNATGTTDKAVLLELATAGATCQEVVLSRKGLMVPSGAPPIPATPARPRVEIQVGNISHLDDYVTWSPTNCKIRWIDPTSPSATLNVTLRNMSPANRLRFAGTAPAAGTTATASTINVTLTGNAWTNFYIAGASGNPSVNDKDAVIETINVATGQLLAREGVMVRIRKNVNALTAAERDRYLEALREVHQTYDFFTKFWNSHSQGVIIAHRLAHMGSAFMPWHRAFILHLERLLQASDPSVALPYWHFDQSSPNMFNPNFMGSNNPASGTPGQQAILAGTNPISTWAIDGYMGIRRKTRYGDAGLPSDVAGATDREVRTEVATLALGANYVDFKNMETTTHSGAHINSGVGSQSWISSHPRTTPKDPLFYFLHCNIDRLWAKWQWVNTRYDPAQQATYDLQGSHDAPPADLPPDLAEDVNRRFGHYLEDSLWPWDNITGGTGTAERPSTAPLTPFPNILGTFLPGSKPTVKTTIDFRLLNYGYDDFYPY